MDGTSRTVYEVSVRIIGRIAVPLFISVFGPGTFQPYRPSRLRSDIRAVRFGSREEALDFIGKYRMFERCNGFRVEPAFYGAADCADIHWVAFSDTFRFGCIHEKDKDELYRRLCACSVSSRVVRIIGAA